MKLGLNSGTYRADSLIASYQRCVNLYPEINPDNIQPTMAITHYQRAGRRKLSDPPTGAPGRCLYKSTARKLYACVGNSIYYIDTGFNFNFIGQILTTYGPVVMMDNGLYVLIVDGSTNGYYISMTDNSFGTINDPAFYGANRVDYMDTFFILNRPFSSLLNSNQFYVSPSEWTPQIPFDPEDVASKVSFSDPLSSLIVLQRQLWLIGQLTGEIWYNSGAQDFTFSEQPGTFVEHGSCAVYSLCKADVSAYWLSRDKDGRLQLLGSQQYIVKALSTRALEKEWQQFERIDDAYSTTYQLKGHIFVQVTFPTADRTYVYDLSTNQWFESVWTDINGVDHRDRVGFATGAYDKVLGLDWQNGRLYQLDPNYYADDATDRIGGDAIKFLRSFPHSISKEMDERITYKKLIADMEVGTINGGTSLDPQVKLRWSDTRGASWRSGLQQSMGRTGEYLRTIQFSRLGLARDRVFELSWSARCKTALQGAWLMPTPHKS